MRCRLTALPEFLKYASNRDLLIHQTLLTYLRFLIGNRPCITLIPFTCLYIPYPHLTYLILYIHGQSVHPYEHYRSKMRPWFDNNANNSEPPYEKYGKDCQPPFQSDRKFPVTRSSSCHTPTTISPINADPHMAKKKRK